MGWWTLLRRRTRSLLLELVHEQGLAAVVATHDPSLVGLADEVLDLRDGRLDGAIAGVQGSDAQTA